MSTLTITLVYTFPSDATRDAMVEKFARATDWSAQVRNPAYVDGGTDPALIANPVSALAWAEARMEEYPRNRVRTFAVREAAKAAEVQVQAALSALGVAGTVNSVAAAA